MESQFTDDDKRFVLTEIIKASRMDVRSLAEFVKANCPSYSWLSVQLPAGRTVSQCIEITEEMTHISIPAESLKREPPSRTIPPATSTSCPAAPPPLHPAQHQSIEGPCTSVSPDMSALQPAVPVASTPQHVHIKPRPNLIPNGAPAQGATPGSTEAPPAKKRRGRPPRQQNLRHGSAGSAPKTFLTLAPLPLPLPVFDTGQALVPGGARQLDGGKPLTPSAYGTTAVSVAGDAAVEARGQKRQLSSDEAPKWEIKAEGHERTPPAAPRGSPLRPREGDAEARASPPQQLQHGPALSEKAQQPGALEAVGIPVTI